MAGDWAPARPPAPEVPLAEASEVADLIRSGRAGHLPGAAWALRADLPRIAGTRPGRSRLIVTSADGYLARWAASDLAADSGIAVSALAGGTDGWGRSGRPLESGAGELLSPPVDRYRRPYEGTDVDAAVMQAYLDWEYGLVNQLERDGTHGFTVLAR